MDAVFTHIHIPHAALPPQQTQNTMRTTEGVCVQYYSKAEYSFTNDDIFQALLLQLSFSLTFKVEGS